MVLGYIIGEGEIHIVPKLFMKVMTSVKRRTGLSLKKIIPLFAGSDKEF